MQAPTLPVPPLVSAAGSGSEDLESELVRLERLLRRMEFAVSALASDLGELLTVERVIHRRFGTTLRRELADEYRSNQARILRGLAADMEAPHLARLLSTGAASVSEEHLAEAVAGISRSLKLQGEIALAQLPPSSSVPHPLRRFRADEHLQTPRFGELDLSWISG
jgi:hypothetical protein